MLLRPLLFLSTACIAASAFAQAAPTAGADTGTPPPMVFPAWGFDLQTLDRSVDPGDDFDAFVNGKWKSATPIPAKYPVYGVGQNLDIVAEAAMRQVIAESIAAKASQGAIEQKIADFYLSYIDTPRIEALGLEPVRPYLDRIAALTTHADVVRLFGDPVFASAIGPGMTIDRDDPSRYVAVFGMAGYALPARDNYLVDNPRNVEMRGKYIDFMTFLLGRAGRSDARARAEQIYALEKEIARNDWDPAVARNPELSNNYMSRSEILALAPELPVGEMIDARGFGGVDRFLVPRLKPTAQKLDEQNIAAALREKIGDGLPAQMKLLAATPVEVWKDWMTVRFLASNAPVLPRDIDQANFDFNATYLYGTKVMTPRHERALGSTDGAMGEAIGKVYVERNFPAESKAEMTKLVDNIRQAMAMNIAELDWMSPETRAAAREKLDAINVKIGYPAKFETYDTLKVELGRALENRLNAARWNHAKAIADFRKPVDREKWFMTPQTVNAYYAAALNEIVFPAAYLQAPNFSQTADPALNYGAIGSTIGHEIGHGFDDSGSRYDAKGRLRNWWTAEDKAKFQKLGANLVSQYAKNCPFDKGKTCINGQLTLGENIGDLAGLATAYRAYRLSLRGQEAPVIDGLTGDQRFFIGYAQKYRNKWSEALQRLVMESDTHSPDDARVNEVLRNFDPWYAAFNVTPDDRLYIAPKDRVKIW